MREVHLYRKMIKAFALAGDNPTTEEELNAYKVATDIKRKLERKKSRSPLSIGYGALVPYNITNNQQKVIKRKWKNVFSIEKEPVITVQVVPNGADRNYKTEDICRLIVQMFKLPYERINRDGFKMSYRLQEKVSFEIRMIKGEISFLFHFPKSLETILTKKLQTVWEKSTITKVSDNDFHYNEENTIIQEMVYRKHELYSLDIDSKSNDPLGSIFESSRLLAEGDQASIFATFEPIHQPTVQTELQEVWRKLRDGETPKKFDFSFRNMLFLSMVGVSKFLGEIVNTLSEIMSNEKDGGTRHAQKYVANPEASKMTIDNLTPATKQKSSKQILRVSHLIATQSNDIEHARNVNRSIAAAYGDIAGDNELIGKEIKKRKKADIVKSINDKVGPKVHIRSNLMSVAESGKLIQLAGAELIEKYKDITSIKKREIEVDKALIKGGMRLGKVTFRGEDIPVYIPCINYDDLCMPWVVVGGMGQGKSVQIANRAIQANLNGFGSIVIDPAKGEIGDLIERVLPPENVIRINLSKFAMALDWCEVKHLKKAKSILTNAILAFFSDQTDDAGAQTVRYLKAVIYAMQTGKLQEILDILEDDEKGKNAYRDLLIKHMPDSFHKVTLSEFNRLSDAMKLKVKMPIYNRLDVILGDEFLVECMQSEQQLNMAELMQTNKCIIIDVRKDELGTEGVNLICNILSSKIDLAMTSRDPQKAEPFFIFFDELHQMQRSEKIWKSAAVESRKWRVGYNFILHSFDQVDRKLIEVIKSAGPNYCLFRSSPRTFKDLEFDLKPFTIEDGVKLEKYHAINIINADNRRLEPFIAKMHYPL